MRTINCSLTVGSPRDRGCRAGWFTGSLTSKWLVMSSVALLAMTITAVPASAQTCLQDEFTAAGNSQKLGCTANDVRVAEVKSVTDLNGAPLTTCFQGTTFSFIADFEIVTSSNSSRSNIGLYFASQGQANALTGTCVDNIVSPLHQCPGAKTGILCGSDNYHELDNGGAATPDTCGDTSSTDVSPVFGSGAEGVTVVVTDFLCQAPAGSTTLQLPNCTSWQVPGKTILCQSPGPNYPYEIAAIPGTTSKCNCGTLPLPITPVTVVPTVQKACTTTNTPGPANFGPGTQSPTSCDAGAEGSTVTYTVAITNTSTVSGNNVVVDQICDDQYGNVFTVSGFTGAACAAGTVGTATNVSCPPNPIAPGATGTCTFTALQKEIKTVTDTVSASGHSSINAKSVFTKTQSNSVTVTSTDAPSSAKVTKAFVGTEAGCATVRYSVDVNNSSTADEALTLSTLTDTAYGDITKLGSGTPPTILGTTCGVITTSSGLGTLSGSPGAGGLPATIAVGGDYKCAFDGQFCSALDNNSCISQVDSVSGTIVGDESETVTQTFNTLTVKECFAATVTSTP
jgi:hypothetical protein